MTTQELFLDDAGRGAATPVLFIHSAGGSSAQFTSQLGALRKTRRAIAIDLRGHGRSPGGRVDALSVHTNDVAHALDRLGLNRVVVVGHSFGAAVALDLAATDRRVVGVYFLDPASDARAIPPDEAKGLLDALEHHYEPTVTGYWTSLLDHAKAGDQILNALLATPAPVVIGTLTSLLEWNPVSRIQALRVPAHSLITRFNDVPNAWHRVARSLETSRIEGTSHWPQLDEPERVNEALETFLRSHGL